MVRSHKTFFFVMLKNTITVDYKVNCNIFCNFLSDQHRGSLWSQSIKCWKSSGHAKSLYKAGSTNTLGSFCLILMAWNPFTKCPWRFETHQCNGVSSLLCCRAEKHSVLQLNSATELSSSCSNHEYLTLLTTFSLQICLKYFLTQLDNNHNIWKQHKHELWSLCISIHKLLFR